MALRRIPSGWELRLRCGKDEAGSEVRARLKLPALEDRAARDRAHRLERMRDTMTAAGMNGDEVCRFLQLAAEAATDDLFHLAEAEATEQVVRRASPAMPKALRTFRQVAEAWVKGDLHRDYPKRVDPKDPRTVKGDASKLALLCQKIGEVPVQRFTDDHAEAALSALPRELAAGTVRNYAALISRVLNLSVFPLRLIERSPLPEGWLPRPSNRKAYAFLDPADDARLLSCEDISRENRLYYGLLAREGCRSLEALLSTWGDYDLERGYISLDKNKTKKPRRWKLGDDVLRALRIKNELEGYPRTGRVFRPRFVGGKRAETFREHLKACGVEREHYHARTPERSPLRLHDLRGTFVTLAMADTGLGKNEAWVMRRTGHTTSAELQKYQRDVDMASELRLTWLGPLDDFIYPGQARALPAISSALPSGPTVTGERGTPANQEERSDFDAAPKGRGSSDLERGPAGSSAAGQAKETPKEGAPAASAGAPVDPMAQAIADLSRLALLAGERGQWQLAARVIHQLEALRAERAGVPSLEAARAKRGGGEGGK